VQSACIDANVLIWGVIKESRIGEENKISLAEHLFEWIQKHSISVIVPTIVITEALIHVPHEKRIEALNQINRDFMVAQFSPNAALFCAKFIKDRIGEGKLGSLKDRIGYLSREVVKMDAQIISIAKTEGVNCIFSEDPNLKKLAEGIISVIGINDIDYQRHLF
jgi:predicted nucleic acid-binding protein